MTHDAAMLLLANATVGDGLVAIAAAGFTLGFLWLYARGGG